MIGHLIRLSRATRTHRRDKNTEQHDDLMRADRQPERSPTGLIALVNGGRGSG